MPAVWSPYESPIGALTLVKGDAGLSALHFPGEGGPFSVMARDDAALADVARQLGEYFSGSRMRFELELDISSGTEFQRGVWDQLLTIPHGTTLSYGELAAATGGPRERIRAVAAAVGRTPIPVIVPCHRVIGARGELTGYRGGLDRKRALLELETAVAGGEPLAEIWAARQMSLI